MRYFVLLCLSLIYLRADAHILIYHRFNDTRYPSTSISNEELRSQFQYLKDNNYTVVKLENIVENLQNNTTIPQKWVAITIDDGYKSFYENGYEIFQEFNYPFTLFVYVEATNKKYPDFMSWDELKSLSSLGDLQYHSYAHPHMTKLSKTALEDDFTKGLRIFEENLGFKPKFFSYPYGELDDETQEIAKKQGFEAIFNQNNGAVSQKSDPYNLDRLAVGEDTNLRYLLSLKYLDALWEEPKTYPKDNILKKVVARVDSKEKKATLYISGLGSRQIEINNGIVNEEINEKLQNSRTRVILQVGNKITTKILIKGK